MFEFSWIWLAMAFCGGVFGAVGIATYGELTLIDTWGTWGPLIWPQTAFARDAVAAVYAKRRGLFENERDICTPLLRLGFRCC